jgi:hypothetical protein
VNHAVEIGRGEVSRLDVFRGDDGAAACRDERDSARELIDERLMDIVEMLRLDETVVH